MSMYQMFQTDGEKEKKGVILDYGEFRVTIARAGGANKRFQKVLELKTKPYRRAIQTETLPIDVGERLLRETYAEAIILDWQIKDEKGNWKSGISLPDNSTGKVTADNIMKVFQAVPELFNDIQSQATSIAVFRQAEMEEDAKN